MNHFVYFPLHANVDVNFQLLIFTEIFWAKWNIGFADELSKARKVGAFKEYIVGRSSEATFSDAFEKQEAIIRCLGGYDPSGDVGTSFLPSFLWPEYFVLG